MEKYRFRNSAFRRIGDSLFSNFFNSDHFLGRDAFQDNVMTKKVRKNESIKPAVISVADHPDKKEET